MPAYYVNRNVAFTGDHEVHKTGCNFLPTPEQRIYIGYFHDCPPALQEARKHFERVNGCRYCSEECHRE